MWIFKCEKWIIFGLFSPIWHNIQRCWGVGKTKGHMKKLPWFLWNRHCPFSPFGIILWTTPLTNGSRNWPTNALQPFDFYVSWKLETETELKLTSKTHSVSVLCDRSPAAWFLSGRSVNASSPILRDFIQRALCTCTVPTVYCLRCLMGSDL